MEWSGQQQLELLLQSGGVGLVLGFVYDIFQLPGYFGGGRRCQFLCDAFYGIVAALVTFFASLAIMDGRMHPLLFAGCGVGFFAQHSSVGCLHRRLLRGAVTAMRQLFQWLAETLRLTERKGSLMMHAASSFIRKGFSKSKKRKKQVKNAENAEKTEKNLVFFEKSS